MAWISVYQEVDGPKLRKLSRTLNTSKAEALGILNFLWFWGMNNADETGLVLEADRRDIEDALAGVTKIPAETVVDSLFDAGWLDEEDGCIYIHDWDTWQEQWYKLQKTRKYDAERKRRAKEAELQRMAQEPAREPETPAPEPEAPKDPPAAPEKPKRKEEEKVKYAEFVRMPASSYEKLVELYGKKFTDTCITELDNYKGSKGKTYKDDYRAILSWVVDRCKEKYPGLIQKSKASEDAEPDDKNPYDWGE